MVERYNPEGSLNLVEDYEKAETEKKAKMCSSKMKCDIKFVQENGDPMSEADDSPVSRGAKQWQQSREQGDRQKGNQTNKYKDRGMDI